MARLAGGCRRVHCQRLEVYGGSGEFARAGEFAGTELTQADRSLTVTAWIRAVTARGYQSVYVLTVWNSQPLRKLGLRSLFASALLVIRIFSGLYSSLSSWRSAMTPSSIHSTKG